MSLEILVYPSSYSFIIFTFHHFFSFCDDRAIVTDYGVNVIKMVENHVKQIICHGLMVLNVVKTRYAWFNLTILFSYLKSVSTW